ncbi:ABC transporter ATP-binding protein [Leucobacter denitrificans]|uniref:ABC-type quaternary amine transporter n=1 Tax=Leucobacter denitrificans TaxID=683042 RepID=A0A7G9S2M3_9MICO|nr:ABC transporter ATP-binding protein [Leucobacter denitrificans]QNN62098.1 ABC transporter ATP-binding protein [Leucobacter denitrificans]
MSAVTVKNVRKAYGDHVVLDDVSLEFSEGEFVSLLGPSGCGKTTLLRVIAGLQSFDSGSVEFDGVDMTNVPAQKRGIGMVFQQYSLFPNMTVRKNIAFPLEAARMQRADIERRVDEMVELIGLEKHQHKRPKQLSGGQQQRVALARALAPRPRILLLDEPLSALDAQVRSRLRDQIRDIQKEVGITTIFVTHDQTEAFAMSDRIVLMGSSGILQVAEPAEIYARPSHREGANFIGRRNDIKVVASEGRLRWEGLFDLPSPVPDGEKVRCSFRAESVNVTLAGGARRSNSVVNEWAEARWVPARVRTRTYLGSTSSLKLQLAGEEKLKAVVTGSLAVHIEDDSAVDVSVDAKDINVYSKGRLVAVGSEQVMETYEGATAA